MTAEMILGIRDRVRFWEMRNGWGGEEGWKQQGGTPGPKRGHGGG